jgi:lipoprotein-releasing system ATP-binding protein
MLLSFKNISKSYVGRGIVLDNLSLDINAGDSIAIMGPSGSGKTTLMNIAGLLDKADHGTVLFSGKDIMLYNDGESAAYRNHNVGFVFQEHLLLPHLTVRENILLPLLASRQSRDDLLHKEHRAEELMQKTGISDLVSKYPSSISGGEAQRAALVRALVNNPSILLADEPTGSLDSRNAEIMGELLSELNKEAGITIILATHSENLAMKMSRTLHLGNGKLY